MNPPTLRHVDPTARRGRLYRTWASLAGTRTAGWISMRTAWKLDPYLLRASRGRFGLGFALPTAVLETRGARTGLVRRSAVIYFHDGDRVTVIASRLGAPQHPAWYRNAIADPDVVFGGQPFRVNEVTDRDEKARLWVLADRVFPPYARYRRRAGASGRTIPILQLEPR